MENTIEKKDITVADLRRSNIPEHFWYATVSSIPEHLPYQKKVLAYYAQMENFIDQGLGLFLFSEQNQTGKTSIASALLKRAIRLRKTVYFTEAGSLKNALTRNESFEPDMMLEQRVKSVDVLAIDDLGKEYRTSSGYAENIFENIIRYRVQGRKATLITTNILPKEIENTYSASLAALLKGTLIILEVSGYNWIESKQQELKKFL